MPLEKGISYLSASWVSLLMNRDYDYKVVQSVVPLPDLQFLMEGSLEENMLHIQELVAEVNF